MPRPDHHDPTSGDGGDDLEEFGREIDLIRSVALEPVELSDAPPDLWQSIAAAAGVDADADVDPDVDATAEAAPATDRRADPEGVDHEGVDHTGVA
ncbi:MAG: hypothetical protein M3Y51_05010, partial [Actinomycetota bacterium]|nr:hypothetical protein [Actinomycetota bacterium]